MYFVPNRLIYPRMVPDIKKEFEVRRGVQNLMKNKRRNKTIFDCSQSKKTCKQRDNKGGGNYSPNIRAA